MMDQQNQNTKEIIEAATELFLTKGFKSVTMDDLANEMGMSKKTIYSYFKTKTELVQATIAQIFCNITQGIDSIRAQNLNPIEEIFTINDFVSKHLKNESSSPEFQLMKYYPKIHSALNCRKFEAVHECITNGLIKGQETGIFRKEADPELISRFYFFSISQIRNKDLFHESDFPTHKVLKAYLDYHIRGIATPKGLKILEQIQSNSH